MTWPILFCELIWLMDINCNALSKLFADFLNLVLRWITETWPRRWITETLLQLFHDLFCFSYMIEQQTCFLTLCDRHFREQNKPIFLTSFWHLLCEYRSYYLNLNLLSMLKRHTSLFKVYVAWLIFFISSG